MARMYFSLICAVFTSLLSVMKTQRALTLENLALRQQVVMLKRSVKRPRMTTFDRAFWVVFARFCSVRLPPDRRQLTHDNASEVTA